MTCDGILLLSHGTVENLDDLSFFLTNIRHGRPAPAELVDEVRRRYLAIGGQSPLNAICRNLAERLEEAIGIPVRASSRLWRPYPEQGLFDLLTKGVDKIGMIPLAQHSADVYAKAAKNAADKLGIEVICAPNWGRNARLIRAYHEKVGATLATIPDLTTTALVMTAHSLPQFVIDAGDPYEQEVRASAEAVASDFRAAVGGVWVAFQSQGLGEGEWLGPDLRSTLEEVARAGLKQVVVVPVGFLADHVEILYDLDIEAKGWAEELGLGFARTESLNSGEALVRALSEVAGALG